MGLYSKSITEATGVTDQKLIAAIEDTMRVMTPNGTLDHLTSRAFRKLARDCHAAQEELGDDERE